MEELQRQVVDSLRETLQEFRLDVTERLAELSTSMKAVERHLATLNGKVASHEKTLNEHMVKFAQQEAVGSSKRTLLDYLMPIFYMFGGGIVLLFLTHADQVKDWLIG